MRSLIRTYTNEQQERPSSLADLIQAGYIKALPIDPMTGARDTWVVEDSRDPKSPGIVDVRSGSRAVSSNGTQYDDW
jgi:general secretion pathway protein G